MLGNIFSENGTEKSLCGDQDLVAVQHHAGYVGTKTEPPRSSAEQLTRVATMRSGGGSAEASVGTLASDVERFL